MNSAKNKLIICFLFISLLDACTLVGVNPNYDKSANTKLVKVTETPRGAMITSDERILFETGKSNIKPDGRIFLKRVAKILNEKTKADALIEGHTDNIGGMKMNQRLSKRRAVSVKKSLVKYGVVKSRLQTKGLAYSKPVADNNTKAGRQENRRTEIIILGESVENIGGNSLADKLSAGLGRFLENASQIIDNVFGKDKK